ncbi:hypothetical protein AURDEDRAFT_158416 [Auricularia subglabra TFB-10046 SS5]|nr:hypothetical protein AURDEDRAFT_158416 [Auricularia subglabra TFB-10046 SS5]
MTLIGHELIDPHGGDGLHFPLLDELCGFHLGETGATGRFEKRYDALCGELHVILGDLEDVIAPKTVMVHVETSSEGKHVFQARMLRAYIGSAYVAGTPEDGDAVHALWWKLRLAYRTLLTSPAPIFQKVSINDLPVELVGMVFAYMDDEDIAAWELVCRLFRNVCPKTWRTVTYHFRPHRELMPGPLDLNPEIEWAARSSNVEYTRQIRDLSVRVDRLGAEGWCGDIARLVLADGWELNSASARLLSIDFIQLGVSLRVLLPRFTALRQVTLVKIFLAAECLQALAATPVECLNLYGCSVVSVDLGFTGQDHILSRVHTLHFRIDSDVFLEYRGLWHVLALLPSLRALFVSPHARIGALNLSPPAPSPMPFGTNALASLKIMAIVSCSRRSAPRFLEHIATAAPNLDSLYLSVPAGRLYASTSVPASTALTWVSAWKDTLTTLSLGWLDNLEPDALNMLETVPRLRHLSLVCGAFPPEHDFVQGLSKLNQLELLRSNYNATAESSFVDSASSALRLAMRASQKSSSHKEVPPSPSDLLFENAVIWDEIWSYIHDCISVYRSRRVSHAWKGWLDATIRKRYNYDRFLCAYFPDASTRKEFRELQALHGAIISGSKALDFLGRFGFAAKSDTDMYATYAGAVALGWFFVEHDYKYLGEAWPDDIFEISVEESTRYSSCDVIRVFKFEGPGPNAAPIDLVLVADAPMCSILHFHATIVMNGLAWDRAFSAYPEATFKHMKGIAIHGCEEAAIDKYRARGFTLDRTLVNAGGIFNGCLPTTPRTFGGSDTWTVVFDTTGIEPKTYTPIPAAHCFALRSLPHRPQTDEEKYAFCMLARAFEHDLLGWKYAVDHACLPFARRILDYMAEHSGPSTAPNTWRVRLVSYNHALTSWDSIMPFIVKAWVNGIPLFLRRARKCYEFRP